MLDRLPKLFSTLIEEDDWYKVHILHRFLYDTTVTLSRFSLTLLSMGFRQASLRIYRVWGTFLPNMSQDNHLSLAEINLHKTKKWYVEDKYQNWKRCSYISVNVCFHADILVGDNQVA
jgi:hypothetical protein